MASRIKRDGRYDERNTYHEKRDRSFRLTTFFVTCVTLNATVVTKNATAHYGTSNPICMGKSDLNASRKGTL